MARGVGAAGVVSWQQREVPGPGAGRLTHSRQKTGTTSPVSGALGSSPSSSTHRGEEPGCPHPSNGLVTSHSWGYQRGPGAQGCQFGGLTEAPRLPLSSKPLITQVPSSPSIPWMQRRTSQSQAPVFKRQAYK